MRNTRKPQPTELRALMNVGPAIERDLQALGIQTVAQLAAAEAGKLVR